MSRHTNFELNTPDMSLNTTKFYSRGSRNFDREASPCLDVGVVDSPCPGSPNFVAGVSLPEFIQAFVSGSGTLPRDSMRTMLSTLEKTQLIELMSQAILISPEVHSTVAYNVASLATFRRLLVRNIAFSSTSEELKTLLGDRYGEIEEGTVVYDRNTGRSKGFAFITFASVESACAAVIDSNNGMIDLNGRPLFLKYAADKLDSSAVQPAVAPIRACERSVNLEADAQASSKRKLFVYNLSSSTTSQSLAGVFASYGAMEDCVVVTDGLGESKRYGFVTYLSEESAWAALQDPSKTIDGRMTFSHLASEGSKSAPRCPRSSEAETVDALFKNIMSDLMTGDTEQWSDSCSTPENLRTFL